MNYFISINFILRTPKYIHTLTYLVFLSIYLELFIIKYLKYIIWKKKTMHNVIYKSRVFKTQKFLH